MGIQEDGILGEKLLFSYLRHNKKVDFFQPDALFLVDGKYYIAECKHQEFYKAPPYDGHGLPKWQVEARLRFQRETGIRACLYVFEKPFSQTGILYWQFLDCLEAREHFDTRGEKPRRVYKLTSFCKETITPNQKL